MRDLAEFDAVVSSHEALCAEGIFFKKRFLWRLVIVDEGHRLFAVKKRGSDKSHLSQKLKQVRPPSSVFVPVIGGRTLACDVCLKCFFQQRSGAEILQ